MSETIWFAVGCLLINGIMDYLSLDFLLSTQTENALVHNDAKDIYGIQTAEKQAVSTPVCIYALLWLALGGLLTLLALYLQFPGMLPVHMLLLLIFARCIWKIALADAAAPIAILFTLYTFIEGFSAIVMSCISANIELCFPGTYVQFSLSLALAFLFSLTLRFIRKTCASALHRPLASCLYLLLIPCALMIFLIRCGLRLDSSAFEEYLSAFNRPATLTALLGMAAAVILFSLTLHIFCKIIRFTEQEQAAALLAGQLQGQQTYIEEARKRNEQYTALRHDLNNHLLVLSGLLNEEKYEAAKKYAQKLSKNSFPLSVPPTTDRAALDILLNEKLSHARRNGIQTSCSVYIPQNLPIDDMDLCVIFSNILDNAIDACRNTEDAEKALSINTKTRSHFLLIESTNTTALQQDIKPGTGLGNIRRMTEKYQGTAEIANADGRFRISILLCPAAKSSTSAESSGASE